MYKMFLFSSFNGGSLLMENVCSDSVLTVYGKLASSIFEIIVVISLRKSTAES